MTGRLVLNSGAVTALALRHTRALATLRELGRRGSWPPIVPTMVLVESTTGEGSRDAAVHRLLKGCVVDESVTRARAARAAQLRTRAGRGSAVDALVASTADGGGVVLTGDVRNLDALAAAANGVTVVAI